MSAEKIKELEARIEALEKDMKDLKDGNMPIKTSTMTIKDPEE